MAAVITQEKSIISTKQKHKPQECDGCLLSLAFGMDTKVSNGDYLRESKCEQGVLTYVSNMVEKEIF